MNDDFDTEMAEGLLDVPPGFEQRVMVRVNAEPVPDAPATVEGRRWLEWLALAAGTAIGLIQLFSFMFGVWSAANLP